MVNELRERLTQQLQHHYEICFRTGLNPIDSGNSAKDNNLPVENVLDLVFFNGQFKEACSLLYDSSRAQKHLHSKGLKTYGDLLDMHDRIIEHITEKDPKKIQRMLRQVFHGGRKPEFMGDGRMYLNILDFLVAIPNIPHSPDPEQPTILGLLISSAQYVMRDERFFASAACYEDIMHLLLIQGLCASGYAKTTTGEFVNDAYEKRWPSENNIFRKESFLFNDFFIKNVIAFHPESILLTAYPRTQPADNESPAPCQVVYNIFNPGQGFFVFSPDDQRAMENSISPSQGFTPDFLRVMHSLMTR